MRTRTILVACLAAVLLAAGGLAAWWYVMAGRAEAAVGEWMQRLESNGYSVAHAGLAKSGFPTRVELTLRDAAVGWSRGSDSARLTIPVLSAQAPIWDPETIRFESRAGATAALAIENETLDFSAASLEGTIRSAHRGEGGRTWMAQGELAELKAARSGAVASPLFTARSAVVDIGVPEALLFSRDAVGTVQVTSRLTDILLHSDTPLGDRIGDLLVSSDLTAPLPGAWSAAALAAWRDRGGRLTLHQGGLRWGPLEVQGAGRLTLDHALRPEGNLEVRARGYEPALDAFARAGMLPPNQVSAMKLALAFISRQPDAGRPREAGADLELDDGWLKLGPFRLVPLAPVVAQ